MKPAINPVRLNFVFSFILIQSFFSSGIKSQSFNINNCPPDIFSYWSFNNTLSYTYDDRINNNDASAVAGFEPSFTPGAVSNGLLFNGSSRVNIPDDNTFDWNANSAFSIEFWMKKTTACASNSSIDNNVIIGRDDPSTPLHWWIGVDCVDEGKVNFNLIAIDNNGENLTGTLNVIDGLWHHIVATRNGVSNVTSIYIDGILDGSVTKTYTAGFNSTEPVNVGWLNLHDNYYYDGSLDELAIYNRNLTQEEITDHYNSGIAKYYCPDTVIYKIMPLGNSITYDESFGDIRPAGLRKGYRQPLWFLLENAGYQIDFVGNVIAGQDVLPAFDPDNEGHPGWTDDQIAANIYNWLVTAPTDIILLHIGTNGLEASALDIEDILNEIDRYEADNSVNIKVLVAKIINRSIYSSLTTTFNNNIEILVNQRISEGDNLVLVDMENGAGLVYSEGTGGDFSDFLHPNEIGYNKMAQKWFSILQNVLNDLESPIHVDAISVSPYVLNITPGNTASLIYQVSPSNATNKNVSWASGNETVATVDVNGIVSAHSAGTATITVTTQDGGFTDNCIVTVQESQCDIDYSSGFTAGQLTFNFNSSLNGNRLRLTPSANFQRGSVYFNNKVDITQFETSFDFQVTNGTSYASDGFTFIIQNSGLNVYGAEGGNLGYVQIPGSQKIGIRFEFSGSPSTGIYLNETLQNVNLPSSLDFDNGHVFNALISYDGSVLSVTITDKQTAVSTVNTYSVNIPAQVGANTAWVGFTGGTGAQNATQEILSWKYCNGNTSVNIPVTGVSIDNCPVTAISINDTYDLNATVNPSGATNKNITWSSNNTYVATVDANGIITAHSAGTATITVTTQDGGFSSQCNITVTNIPVTGVSFDNCPGAAISINNTFDLNATVNPSNAINKNITWSSGNETVATVDANGIVTAHSAGMATITVTTQDGGYNDNCNVTVQSTQCDIDYSLGFTAGLLTSNFNSSLNGNRLRLTSNANFQRGSAYFNNKVDITQFETSFDFQVTNGTSYASDGFTFIVQNSGLNVYGTEGGNLGYIQIPGSQKVGIRFEFSGSPSTGIYLNESLQNVNLPSSLDFDNGHVFNALISYDGSVLSVTITDKQTAVNTTNNYTVNIPAQVGANTAWVGFTGGTGAQNATQEILSWKYCNGSTSVNIPVTGVSIDNCPVTAISINDTYDLNATVNPSGATNKNITWSSNNTYVATVDANGIVTAHSAGAATITVTTQDGGFTSQCNITVTNIPVTGVSIDNCPGTAISINNTFDLNATVNPANATNKNVSWASGNETVATIDVNGIVTAHSAGTATITVTTQDGGFTSQCIITVTNIPVTGISIDNCPSAAISINNTHNLNATVNPSNATNKNVSWASGNETVATVDVNGIVSAHSAGTATITVTTQDGGFTDNCIVTVQESQCDIDYSSGFTAGQLTFNFNSSLNGNRLRLTPSANFQRGSVYFNNKVDITQFENSFDFQVTNGTSYASDGFTFIIQNSGLNVYGAEGGNLGYVQIPGSQKIGIRFEFSGSPSTGIYLNETLQNVNLPSSLDFDNGHVFNALISYDGSVLSVTITDKQTTISTVNTYSVNIPALVGANTAWAGFTGGTGAQNATQEIINWKYCNGSILKSIPWNFKTDEENDKLPVFYPNPVTDMLYLKNVENIKRIEITDITSKLILVTDNYEENEIELDMSNLKNGMYFLRFTSSDHSMKIVKIIKQ